ncbi:hypothetical protein [Streptomyces sp. NPDC002758]
MGRAEHRISDLGSVLTPKAPPTSRSCAARLLGLPTDDPAMNVTHGRLARQGFLTHPDEATTRNGLGFL